MPNTVCVCVFVCAVSACPVRCNRGRTTAPTPVGEARMPSRGRWLHRSSRALSSGTRPSPRRRRPKSPARPLPSFPPAPRGRSAAQTITLCPHSAPLALFSCSSGHLSPHSIFGIHCCAALWSLQGPPVQAVIGSGQGSAIKLLVDQEMNIFPGVSEAATPVTSGLCVIRALEPKWHIFKIINFYQELDKETKMIDC